MTKYGSVAMLFLAGLAAIYPAPMAWIYVLAFMAFEFWLLRRMRVLGRTPVPVGEPPYHFADDEAQYVRQYRFYFTYPTLAHDAASMLAALGLSALVLSPWLLFRQQLVPAFLVAINLLAVGALTKRLSPVMVQRIAASKGDRGALRRLEIHEPLWAKIRAANEGGREAAR